MKLFVNVMAADMRYFARNKFFGSLVHKKKFGLISQAVFKLCTYFVKGGRIPLFSLNELGEKSWTIIIVNFVNKAKLNSFHWSEFKARAHDIFFS